ncbi:MAG: acetate--CoA ligase family protein [Anaerolineae bacterium]
MTHWGEAAFNPRSVAVLGASAKAGKLGQVLMRNLTEGFPGIILPINPNETEVMGRPAYARLSDAPGPIDLAVIALPPEACVEAMHDCAAARVRTALVLSAGFAEVGPEGRALQDAMLAEARTGNVRLIGPNCFGLYNCNLGLNASMGLGLPPTGGNISLATQSGAYGMAIFVLAQERRMRFAKILSHGNKPDVTDHEILDYFSTDAETEVLCLFLESVNEGRAFYEALVRTTAHKPVVIAKTGRSTAGQRAAASHTAALTGDATAFVTAVRQAGAILAENGLEMVDIAEGLGRQPLPAGRRVGIITNSGGTGVELADLCERLGLNVPELSQATQSRILPLIPAFASPRNPVDVTPAWTRFPAMYGGSIEALYESDEVDIVIPILLQRSALMRENVEAVRDAVLRCQQERGLAKPTYVCWVAGREGDDNKAILQETGIPVYEWPERTARVAAAIARYAEAMRLRATQLSNLEPIRKLADRAPTPGSVAAWEPPLLGFLDGSLAVAPATARDQAAAIIAQAKAEKRMLLLESEVKALLAAYGARIPRETLCVSAAEAHAAAASLPGLCVMKIVSPDISHKSEVGGVRVGVARGEAGAVFEALMASARAARPEARIVGVSVQELVAGQEVMIGGLRDPHFGPLLLFGLGGIFVEILRDVAYRLVPAAPAELAAMVREVKGYPLLAGARGREPVNLPALLQTLQAAAWLLADFPEIVELDLNPVFAGPQTAVVADGRAVLAA